MSILSGQQILAEVEAGRIEIDPFRKEHVNPASIDLTLGDEVAKVEPNTTELLQVDVDGRSVISYIDVKEQVTGQRFRIPPKGIVLHPRHLYLMHTAESIYTKHYVGVLDGKSSLARVGVTVHLTAGYFDPGYRGQGTLEVTTVYPVRLYAGMRICQMRFHELSGEADDYQAKGHYTGDQRGPQPSRIHEQFK